MTEDQAKEIITCHRSLGVPDERGPNGEGIRQGGPWNCLGSVCSAWRWQTEGWVLAFDGTSPILRRPANDPPTGYCGLAGKP